MEPGALPGQSRLVVDAQGFVIASRGNVPREGFDGPGAELCFAMDQMDRLDPEGGSLDALELHFKGRTIVAVKARRDDPSEAYVIAFVGSRPLSEEIRDALLRQLSYSLPVLS